MCDIIIMCCFELTLNLTTFGMSPSIKGLDDFTRSPLFSHENPNVMHSYELCADTHRSRTTFTRAEHNSTGSCRWPGRQKESDAFLALSMFSFYGELYSCLPQPSRSPITSQAEKKKKKKKKQEPVWLYTSPIFLLPFCSKASAY